jgi:hypothetical protein
MFIIHLIVLHRAAAPELRSASALATAAQVETKED